MLTSPDWALLTDPVCGRSVEATSPHRAIHGGALFAFCSPACRSQFVELPSRYAVIAGALAPRPVDPPAVAVTPSTSPPSAPPASPRRPIAAAALTPPAASSPPSRPAPLTAPAADSRPARAVASGKAGRPAGTTQWEPIDPQTLGGAHGPFTWLLAWRERRFATQCAHRLLKLHQGMAMRYPELKGEVLYRRVVAAHLHDDAVAVDAVLQYARQSFAIWPTERALCFRDVVHYLAVSQFIATHHGARWVYADMKRIVHALIPQHL